MPLHCRYSKIVTIIITIDLNVSVSFPQINSNCQGNQTHIIEIQDGDTWPEWLCQRHHQDVDILDKQV